MALDITPLVNGTAYSWAQIRVTIGGRPVTGITQINYKRTQEKVNNYGAGNAPTSRGRGRKEYEASITLRLGEIQSISRSAENGDITNLLPFDITVSFLPEDATIPVNHIIKNAEFTEDFVEVSEGDTSIEMELPLIISGFDKTL